MFSYMIHVCVIYLNTKENLCVIYLSKKKKKSKCNNVLRHGTSCSEQNQIEFSF